MKFTILGYSQENSISIGLDLQDLLILRYISDFSPKMDTIQRDGKPLFWVLYSALLEDIPMCGIKSKDVLGRRLKKMEEKGVLTHAVVNEKNGVRGTFSFWGFGENYMRLVDDSYTSTQESAPTYSKVDTPPTQESAPYLPESRNKDHSTKDHSTKDPNISPKISDSQIQAIIDLYPTRDEKRKGSQDLLRDTKTNRETVRKLIKRYGDDAVKDAVLGYLETKKGGWLVNFKTMLGYIDAGFIAKMRNLNAEKIRREEEEAKIDPYDYSEFTTKTERSGNDNQ